MPLNENEREQQRIEDEWLRTGRVPCADCGHPVKTDSLTWLPEHGCASRQRTNRDKREED